MPQPPWNPFGCGTIRAGLFLRSRQATDHDFYTGGLEHLKCFGPAISREQNIDFMIDDCLAGLYSGALWEVEILTVFNNLECHGLRINDDEIGGSPESRIHF